MLEALAYAAKILCWLLMVALAAPVLYWIGRPLPPERGNMVVDDGLLVDDPGVVLDEGVN